MPFEDLRTPAALVDVDVVEANTARMAERATRLGAKLRPHVKTHKTVEGARLQVRGHGGGITASTLAEVRFFAEAGFRDITYAVPIAPWRLREAAELARRLDRLSLLLDSDEALAAVEACGGAQGRRFPVLLKVDCGYHRAGVDPARPESRALAARVASSAHVDFRGLLTHAGHSYEGRNPEEIREVGRRERETMTGFAARLREDGIEVPEVSVGATPTVGLAESLEGISEVRPGNYVFYDAFQAAVGSCAPGDVAFTVLATVIGSYPGQGRLVIDAGALALSKDPGPTHVDPDCGYGTLRTTAGESLPELRLQALSQEHGTVVTRAPKDPARFPVGTRLRVVPNHSCLAAALFDRYCAVRGTEPVGEWRPVSGW